MQNTLRSQLIDTLSRRGYSERTVEAYVYWFDKTQRHFNGKSVADLKTDEVLAYLDFLQKRYKNLQTFRSAKSALKYIYSEITPRPEIVSLLPKVGRSMPEPFIPKQSDVLEVIEHVEPSAHKILFSCIYGMGLELIDARNIRIKDVNLRNFTITISAKRTRKLRSTPIPIAVRESVAQLAANRRGHEFLFSDEQGMPIHEQKLQRSWAKSRDKCGAPKLLTSRALRHAYVNHLQLLGVQIGDIISHLGYNKSSSFEYYAQASTSPPAPFSPLDRLIAEDIVEARSDSQYVADSRIQSLLKIKSEKFDYKKLIHLLRELNIASLNGCVFSVCFLVRAIVDHIPPAFDQQNFNGVVSNYSGSKSFKKGMDHLQGALKNIADGHIHTELRHSEDIPTRIQIDFRSQLDLLIGEIIRVSK